MNIRLPQQSDSSDLKRILKDTELFPPDMLEGMLTPFFENPSGAERWLVCENESGSTIGFCYYRMEPLTEGPGI